MSQSFDLGLSFYFMSEIGQLFVVVVVFSISISTFHQINGLCMFLQLIRTNENSIC